MSNRPKNHHILKEYLYFSVIVYNILFNIYVQPSGFSLRFMKSFYERGKKQYKVRIIRLPSSIVFGVKTK